MGLGPSGLSGPHASVVSFGGSESAHGRIPSNDSKLAVRNPGLFRKFGEEHQLAAGCVDLQPGRVLARQLGIERAAHRLIPSADYGADVNPFSVLAYRA